jgi:hypothetical protein
MGLPFKPAVAAWLADSDNIATLQAMLLVTHFHEVPDDELNGGLIKGEPNRILAHEMMSRFFL